MPKSSDWRNRPFANFRPRQTKVSPCLTLDWWSFNKLYHLTWIRFILASKTKVTFHHLIWIWFVLASCQLEQTSGSLLRHPGEQGDELHWGEHWSMKNNSQKTKNWNCEGFRLCEWNLAGRPWCDRLQYDHQEIFPTQVLTKLKELQVVLNLLQVALSCLPGWTETAGCGEARMRRSTWSPGRSTSSSTTLSANNLVTLSHQ